MTPLWGSLQSYLFTELPVLVGEQELRRSVKLQELFVLCRLGWVLKLLLGYGRVLRSRQSAKSSPLPGIQLSGKNKGKSLCGILELFYLGGKSRFSRFFPLIKVLASLCNSLKSYQYFSFWISVRNT